MQKLSNKPAIKFSNVYKSFYMESYASYGLKNLLLHLPQYLMNRFQREYFTALKNVSFQVAKGESLGIIGSNGSGKSTTLGLIAGVLQTTKGSVRVNGKVLPLLELGAGFHPELSGKDNIILNGILLGMTKAQVMDKLDAIIHFSEMKEFIYQPLRTYSSGMIARLGFSVIAHLEPSILLIDEILAVGDDRFQKKCIKKLKEFRLKETTIILVSHKLDDIKKICDRVGLLNNGRLIEIGTPNHVISKYKNLIKN